MYSIWISDKAEKQLEKLPKNVLKIVLKKIYSIRDDPFHYLKKLEGSRLWRLRILEYRVIIDVIVMENKIIVLTVDNRSRVYGG